MEIIIIAQRRLDWAAGSNYYPCTRRNALWTVEWRDFRVWYIVKQNNDMGASMHSNQSLPSTTTDTKLTAALIPVPTLDSFEAAFYVFFH